MNKLNTLLLFKKVGFTTGFIIFFPISINAANPVFDAANVAQTTATAGNTAKQLALQGDQYKNMIKNTESLSNYNFDASTSNVGNLLGDINTLKHHKRDYGSTENYLSKYRNIQQYYQEKCFSSKGCTPEEWKEMKKFDELASDAQKKANDAMLRNVDRQQEEIKKDSVRLSDLQKSTRNSTGQMAAIQNSNQLASYQSHQMLQMRGLLIAQQNAEATRRLAEESKKAQETVAAEKSRESTFKPTSNPRSW